MRAGDWMVLWQLGPGRSARRRFFRESDQKLVKTMELKHFELYNLKRDRDQKESRRDRAGALEGVSVQLAKYREVQAEGRNGSLGNNMKKWIGLLGLCAWTAQAE